MLKQLCYIGLIGILTSCGVNDDKEKSGKGMITEKGTNECVDYPEPITGQYSVLKTVQRNSHVATTKKEYIQWDKKTENVKISITINGKNQGFIETKNSKIHIKNNYKYLDSVTLPSQNSETKQSLEVITTSDPDLRWPIQKVCKGQRWSDGNVTFTMSMKEDGKTTKIKHTTVTPIYEIEDVNVIKNIALGEFNTFILKTSTFLHQSKGDMTPSISYTWYDIETGIVVYREYSKKYEELIEYSK